MVVPTLDGGARFRACLDALSSQRPEPPALVVVDSGSGDGTARAAEEAGAHLLRTTTEAFDHGATRNQGAAALPDDVDVIVFLVQDAVPQGAECLATLGRATLAPGVGAVTARQVPPEGASPLTCSTVERGPAASREVRRVGPFAPAELEALDGAAWRPRLVLDDVCCAVRAPLFRAVGFRTTAFGEDALLAYDLLRAGWALGHEPAAVVAHGHEYDPRAVAPRYEQDARFFRETFGVRVRPGLASALKGFLAETAADRRWLAAHPGRDGAEVRRASRRLRWAQVWAQWRGSRGPLGSLPAVVPAPTPRELAA